MPSSISNSEAPRADNSPNVSARRIGRALLACALVFGVYQAMIWMRLVPPSDGIHQAEDNFIRAQRYVYAMDAGMSTHVGGLRSRGTVMVGSSLAANLGARDWGDDFVNLGLSGGSSQTGLELVRRASRKPALVLVEVDETLERARDDELVDSLFHPVWKPLRSRLSALRQEYQPVSVAMNALKKWKSRGGEDSGAGLVAPAMRERLIRDLVAAGQLAPQHKAPSSGAGENRDAVTSDGLRLACRRMRAQIEDIKRGGTRVVLFRVPRDPAVDATPLALRARRVIASEFPPRVYHWLPDAPPRLWHTNDGEHLTPDDVKIFSAFLKHQSARF